MLKRLLTLPGPEYNGIFVLPSSALEFSFKRFLHVGYGFVSQFHETLSLDTGAFNYFFRRQVFFRSADFTLHACVLLAGCHLKCFGDGCISAGDVFEKEEDGIIDC